MQGYRQYHFWVTMMMNHIILGGYGQYHFFFYGYC